MRPEEKLICRIFEQAAEDYMDLIKRNIESRNTRHGTEYSIKDIERFFGSKWCGRLLEMIGCNLTGEQMFSRIKTQYGVYKEGTV